MERKDYGTARNPEMQMYALEAEAGETTRLKVYSTHVV
jgi:hypothetical protein